MRTEKNIEILKRYLPENCADKVLSFLESYKVQFKISSHRNSKRGDFCAPNPRSTNPKISVNGDLNPYMFLTVFLHEAAHLLTWQKYERAVRPHGHEWQACFQELLMQYLSFYPEEIVPHIHQFCKKVPYSMIDKVNLERALQSYNGQQTNPLILFDLSPGDKFSLQSYPQDVFVVETKRRTRFLCRSVRSGKRFLVSGAAFVVKVE